MNAVSPELMSIPQGVIEPDPKFRKVVTGKQPVVLADIYEESTNLIIWQRQLPKELVAGVNDLAVSRRDRNFSVVLKPSDARSVMHEEIDNPRFGYFVDDAAELVDMFCYLFGLDEAGLRLRVLHHSMCPKFHVDHVPCRLVTTYCGVATEWLAHESVDRKKLGLSGAEKSDQESGLYQTERDIQELARGEVALMKGEKWPGNKGAGLVHRSPAVAVGEPRLLLTLDFCS